MDKKTFDEIFDSLRHVYPNRTDDEIIHSINYSIEVVEHENILEQITELGNEIQPRND